jgi:hypothetical protein
MPKMIQCAIRRGSRGEIDVALSVVRVFLTHGIWHGDSFLRFDPATLPKNIRLYPDTKQL